MSSFQQPAFGAAEFVMRWLADIQRHPRDEQHPSSLSPRPQGIVDNSNISAPRTDRLQKDPKDIKARTVRLTDDSGTNFPKDRYREENERSGRRHHTKRKDRYPRSVSLSGSNDHHEDEGSEPCLKKNPDGDIRESSSKYARRQRQKTKSDRYDYKHIEEKPSVKRPSKKRSRKKAGAVLNEEFHAPNVSTERLTLKTKPGAGFLAKGKSSAQIDCSGLPDLTFSEMAFLSNKRRQDDARFRNTHLETTSRKNRTQSNQELSDFFSRATASEPEARSPRHGVGRAMPSQSSKLLHHPHGQDSGTASINMSAPDGPYVQKTTKSAGISSGSYISPSKSSLRPRNRSARHIVQLEDTLPTLGTSPAGQAVVQDQFITSKPARLIDSTNDLFLRDLTTETLLHGVEAFAHRRKRYYSLDELKELARWPSSDRLEDGGLGDDAIENSDNTPDPAPAEPKQIPLYHHAHRDEMSTARPQVSQPCNVGIIDGNEALNDAADDVNVQQMTTARAYVGIGPPMCLIKEVQRSAVADDCIVFASEDPWESQSLYQQYNNAPELSEVSDVWFHTEKCPPGLPDYDDPEVVQCLTQQHHSSSASDIQPAIPGLPSHSGHLGELDEFDLQLLHVDGDRFSESCSATVNDQRDLSILHSHDSGTHGPPRVSTSDSVAYLPDDVLNQRNHDRALGHRLQPRALATKRGSSSHGQGLSQPGSHVPREHGDAFMGFSRPHILY